MTQDRPALGILLMLVFCLVVPFSDALAKLLGGRIEVAELVAIRMGVQVVVLAPVVWLAGLSVVMSERQFRLTIIRALLHVAGIGAMFVSLRYLPLADAVAIAFVMPFIMLLLGRFVLGEEVGIRRILACAVGFAGTLMVIRPSFAEVGWPALLPVIAAVVFALFMLVTRVLAKGTDPIALQFVSGISALAMLLPVMAVLGPAGVAGFAVDIPSGDTWILVLAMSLLGTLGHLLMTWSLRLAPSATLAPMQYLEIPVAALVGWFVFREFPDGLALAGIVVTIVSGLYIVYREQVVSRSVPARPGPAPSVARE